MDTRFWHEKWQKGEIGFHEGRPNTLFTRHFHRLGLTPGARVFLPLCGKTRDIPWLLGRGFEVVGIELVEQAVRELFGELGLEPDVSGGSPTCYRAGGLEIFQGDFFDLTEGQLGRVDAVYDRAALIALPSEARRRYAAHLVRISRGAPQLLVTFDYDQSRMDGPPFSVTGQEVHSLYDGHYRVVQLDSREVEGGLKGLVDATENAWLLTGG